MTQRQPKIKAVANYLTGHAGIPGIGTDGSSELIAPYPLKVRVTTTLDFPYWVRDLKELPESGISLAIRMNRQMDSVADAQVAMRLGQFAPLLQDYWVKHYEGRGE